MVKSEGVYGVGMAGEFSLGCNKFGVLGVFEVETSLRGRCLFRFGFCGVGGGERGFVEFGEDGRGLFFVFFGSDFCFCCLIIVFREFFWVWIVFGFLWVSEVDGYGDRGRLISGVVDVFKRGIGFWFVC